MFSGNPPERWFEPKYSSCRSCSWVMEFGIVPTKWFVLRSSRSSDDKLPIESLIFPERSFPYKDKIFRLDIWKRDSGREPVRWLVYSSSVFKFDRDPRPEGIGPLRLFSNK
jgi:hypothetical protein